MAIQALNSAATGLRALSTLGFQTPSQKDCADVVGHFMRGLHVTQATQATQATIEAHDEPVRPG